MRIFIVFFLTICTLSLWAQQQFEGGLFMGISNYQGDLVDSYLEISETKLAVGASMGYSITNHLGAQLIFRKGKISGNDANSAIATRRDRNLRFRSDLFELALLGEWYFLGRDRFLRSDDSKWFNPYGFMGLAVAYTESHAEGEGLPEIDQNESLFLSVPVGGGLKFNVYDHVILGIEAGFRPAFSDYLDGVSKLGNPNGNDWYLFGGFNLSFVFGNVYY